MNNEAKGLQFLVNQKHCSLIHNVTIRMLRKSMKITCVCDNQSHRGKRLPPPPPSQNSLEEALRRAAPEHGPAKS